MYEDRYFILVANGPLSGRNEFFDILSASIYCGSIHTHQVMVVCQFIWRYQMICKADGAKKPFVKTWWVLIPIAWCFAQAFNTFYLFALTNQPGTVTRKGRQILERTGWEPGTQAFPGMGHREFEAKQRFRATFTRRCTMASIVTLCGGYVVIIWCQYKIIKFFRRSGTSYLESTRRIHAEVNRAMVALAVTPLLTSMGPTLILLTCMIVDFSAGPITVYMSVGMSLIVLVNPTTTIYFVRQYRKATIAKFQPFMRHVTKITQIRIRIYAVTPSAIDTKSLKDLTGNSTSSARPSTDQRSTGSAR
ncbi:hypothetical protein AAVH_25477 [Aphelenchoides avenae]|nr:hypothetical protein AAVH_25477 [Aphelenchus avenae]